MPSVEATPSVSGFEKIGTYRIGPEAARMMDEGYRMVTIEIASPGAYDLRRPT